MKKKNLKSILLLNLLVISSFVLNAQDIPLKVKNGILYTVNGKWGSGTILHYSKGNGFNYKAKIKVAQGEQTLEYFFLKDDKVYNITFMAQAGKKYQVCNDNDKPVVKEDKNILTTAKIVNVSSKSGENDFQIVPGITDESQAATLIYNSESDYFTKYNKPIFNLRKIDNYWGDGTTGYISGKFNGITDDAFNVMLPAGKHKLSAFLEFGSYNLLSIKEYTFDFEAGKTYTIVFKDFGVDTKKKISEIDIKLILGSAKIVEIND